MARSGLAFAVVLLAFASPLAAAGPAATWKGTTDALVCADGACTIVTPPVDDARVDVGTGRFTEVRLALDSGTEAPLALVYLQDGRSVVTEGKTFQRTAWIKAPADRVLEVSVLDLAPWSETGVRPGVPFTLVAHYR